MMNPDPCSLILDETECHVIFDERCDQLETWLSDRGYNHKTVRNQIFAGCVVNLKQDHKRVFP